MLLDQSLLRDSVTIISSSAAEASDGASSKSGGTMTEMDHDEVNSSDAGVYTAITRVPNIGGKMMMAADDRNRSSAIDRGRRRPRKPDDRPTAQDR